MRDKRIVYFVDIDVERKSHVVAGYLEVRMVQQMGYIVPRAKEEVSSAKNLMTISNQTIAEMTADKFGPPV